MLGLRDDVPRQLQAEVVREPYNEVAGEPGFAAVPEVNLLGGGSLGTQAVLEVNWSGIDLVGLSKEGEKSVLQLNWWLRDKDPTHIQKVMRSNLGARGDISQGLSGLFLIGPKSDLE